MVAGVGLLEFGILLLALLQQSLPPTEFQSHWRQTASCASFMLRAMQL